MEDGHTYTHTHTHTQDDGMEDGEMFADGRHSMLSSLIHEPQLQLSLSNPRVVSALQV